MPLSTQITETPIRVRYAETDASGIVHHTAYVTWLEVGRVEWLRHAGLSYREIEKQGYSLPVVELHVRFVTAARFDDRLTIRTALADVRSRSARFIYEVVTDEAHPRQVANGMSRHICLLKGQISTLPEELRVVIGHD